MENKKSSQKLVADSFTACSSCNFLNDKQVVFCKNCGQPLLPPPKTFRWGVASVTKNTVPIMALMALIGLIARSPAVVFVAATFSTICVILYFVTRKHLVHQPEAILQAKQDSLVAKETQIQQIIAQLLQRTDQIQKALDNIRQLNDPQALELAEKTSQQALRAIDNQRHLLQIKSAEIIALRVINLLAYKNSNADFYPASIIAFAEQTLSAINDIMLTHQERQLPAADSASLVTYKEILEAAILTARQTNTRQALDVLADSLRDIAPLANVSASDTSSAQNMEALFQTLLLRFDSEFTSLTDVQAQLDSQKDI